MALTCSVWKVGNTVCAETGDADAKLLLKRIVDVIVNTDSIVRTTIGIALIFKIVTMIHYQPDYY
jgi:hypothetical protein